MTATASKPRFKSEKKHGLPAKAFDALQEGIQEVLDDKDWAGFLENIRKISDYSFNNRILIMFEQLRRGYPMSHWIAGKCKWRDQFKRNLKKGEFKKPIWILGPVIIKDEDTNDDVLVGFRGVRVYDVNQTEGEPLPEPDTSDMMSPIQADISPKVLDALVHTASIREPKVKVNLEVPKSDLGSAQGCCWFQDQGRANKIDVREDLNLATKISVLAHELGHAILHNRDEYENFVSPGSIKELEAESVAYLVCNHYNMDVGKRSFKYIVHHNHATDTVVQDLMKSGTRIVKAYEFITEHVDKIMEKSK